MLIASPAPNHGVVQGTPTGTTVEGFALSELLAWNMKLLARLVFDIASWTRVANPVVLTGRRCGSLFRLQISNTNLFVFRSIVELSENRSTGPSRVLDYVQFLDAVLQ